MVSITLATLAALSVIAALMLGGMIAQAQSGNGAVPNLRLSSAVPGQLTISWDASDPAPSDYRIVWAKQDLSFLSYQATNEANRGNAYPGGDERSITLNGLTKGATFKARARARYTSGGQNDGPWSGPWTDTATARVKDDPPPLQPTPEPTAAPQPPAAPTGFTASEVTHDSVTLSWTDPEDASINGYRVLRGTDANSLSTLAQDTGSAGTEYTDSTVAAETTYYYAVLALSQNGDGAQSATVSATTPTEPQPPEPLTLQLSSNSPGALTISWDAPEPAPSDYRIVWAMQDLDFPSYSATNEANRGNEYPDGSKTSITLPGLTKDATFKARARARYTSGGQNNGAWSGPWTDTLIGRVKNDPPAAPTGLSASEVEQESVTINWTAPSQGTVTGYRILRGTETGSLSTIEENTGSADTEYTDTTVTAGTSYYYAVLALSQDGDGAQSVALSVTTLAAPQQTEDNRESEGQTIDTTAPAFASATADGTSLVITFDEDLAAAVNLPNSAFIVKKTPSGGKEETVTLSKTTAPVIGGKTVTLTLSTALVSTDGSLKVSYTKPTTGAANKLVDATGNETAAFTDQTVTNSTGRGGGIGGRESDDNGNTAPTASNKTVTISEDAVYTFTAADFSFMDTDSGDTLASLKIISPPGRPGTTPTILMSSIRRGLLWLGDYFLGYPHFAGGTRLPATVSKADIDAGRLEYQPSSDRHGNNYASFRFKVNDGTVDSAAEYTFTFNVTSVEDAPELRWRIPDQRAIAGVSFRYRVSADAFVDADGDTLSYTATKSDGTALPTWLSFAAGTRTFSGTPQSGDGGRLSVKVTASDGNGGSASDTFDILVNAPPSASSGSVTLDEDTIYTFKASDFNFVGANSSDTLHSVKITSLANSGLSLWSPYPAPARQILLSRFNLPLTLSKADIDVGRLLYSPWLNQNGNFRFTFKVNDGTEESIAEYTMNVSVTPVNDAPVVQNPIPDQGETHGTRFSYRFSASAFRDWDRDPLTYSATKSDGAVLPAWLSFTAGTRTFSGTPQSGDVGTLSVKVTASDGNGGSVSDTFDIVVR